MEGDKICSLSAWSFAQMDEVWRHFKPQTPYGRDRASEKRVYGDAASLSSIYDDTDEYGSFVRRTGDNRSRADRISWHLGRIPRLPSIDAGERSSASTMGTAQKGKKSGSSVDIFIFKKFLANYSALCDLADERIRCHFNMEFKSNELAALLGQGGSDPETFYVSEKYDSRLLDIRDSVASIGAKIERCKADAAASVKSALGIDLAGKEFVTVPRDTGLEILQRNEAIPKWRLSVEVNDEYSFLVRLLPDSEMLTLESEREKLYERERAIEDSVSLALSERIEDESDAIMGYVDALTRFDLAKARYELKQKFNLCRPEFGAGKMSPSNGGYSAKGAVWEPRITIGQGIFLPLSWECGKMGTRYTPLDISLERSAAVLFGSNMGGKTVVLKSILFFQVMAQSGLGVPAANYSTAIFSYIGYVGEKPEMAARGLSSFGFEIRSLSDIVEKTASDSCLVAFDEFAQTTSSQEAEALLSAVIMFFAETGRPCLALFATHFQGVRRDGRVQYFKMAGLDVEAARRSFQGFAVEDRQKNFAERIKNINSIMRYFVIEESSDESGQGICSSDALEVASLLGLDERIIAAAREYRTMAGRDSR
ncbi:MAG: hypothetical protein LLF89_11165 [Spirochaetaceae bacterium]|nr:hypothetical protein [Spirochaetaceae bacterium]